MGSRFFILFLLLTSIPAFSAEFYVSPDGKDTNPGTKQAPFASIEYALQVVQVVFKKSPGEDCTIWLEEGVYRLSEPLVLRSETIQNNKGILTIAGISGSQPVISGGEEVTQWTRTEDGLWKGKLPQGVPEGLVPRELFVNGQRAIRARFPNEGYLRVAKVGTDRRTHFFFEEGEFPLPSSPQHPELVLLHDWSITRIPIKDIDSAENKLTAVDSIGPRKPDFFNLDNWEPHPRYFLENDRQFLDADYEWYFDEGEKTFLLQLPPSQNANELEIITPVSEGILILSGTKDRPLKNLRFKDLVFEHSAWTIPARTYAGVQACHYDSRVDSKNRTSPTAIQTNATPKAPGWAVVPAAIQGDWVENSSFDGCIFRHMGGTGLWLGTGSANNSISDCEFSDISGNGIMIGEGRDRLVNGQPWWKEAPDQVASGNTIQRTVVTDCGVQFFGAVGIWCGLTAETIIRDNVIYGLPYTGISIGWMWSPVPTPCRANILERNHIHHIMQKLSDGGGIYMLGLQPGSKILNNRIHDVHINAGRAESNGMFLDEGTTDVVVANNLIYEIAKSPLRFHKATTNIVRDNHLFCKQGMPPIRYNATKEEDIVKIDNMVVSEGENGYEKHLQKAIEEWETQKR